MKGKGNPSAWLTGYAPYRRGDEGVNKRALTFAEEIRINLFHGNNFCIKIPLPLIPVDGSNQANSISPGLTEKNPPRQDP